MATCSASELMASAKCFGGVQAQYMPAINAVLLCKILQAVDPMATCDTSDLLASSKCFLGLPFDQLQAINTQLLCEILNAGGTGGQSCISGGTEDPVAAPDCSYALYYREDTGAVWLWLPGTSAWAKIIGGP